MKNLMLALVFLFASGAAVAAETKGGYFACLTEGWHDEMMNFAVRKDQQGMSYMVKSNKCFTPRQGIKVSIVESKWTISKLRAYVGDQALDFWIVNEGIKR